MSAKISSEYTYTRLHTDSRYVDTSYTLDIGEGSNYANSSFAKRIDAAIKTLEGREKSFYARFGCSSYEELMKKIQEFFQDPLNKQDLQVLKNFTADNLRTAIKQYFEGGARQYKDQTVKLVLKSDKAEEKLREVINEVKETFSGVIDSSGFLGSNGDGFTITASAEDKKEVELFIGWNTVAVKTLINKMQSTNFTTKSNRRNKYNIGVEQSEKALIKYIKEHSDIIQVKKIEDDSPITFRSSSLAYTKEELEKGILPPQQAQTLFKEMQNFVFNSLGGGASHDLKSCLERTWNENIKGIDFFLGGENWENYIVGGLGEFITSAYFYYLDKKIGNNNLQKEIIELTGQKLNNYHEQSSSDIFISFLESAGIQVKNYNGAFVRDSTTHKLTNKQRTVEVNLHPSDIPSLTKDKAFIPYLLNSYFNEDVKKIPNEEALFKQFFENHAYEFLNLSLDDSEIPDRVAFYLIGMHLIPGSEILRAAYIYKESEKQITVSKVTMSNMLTTQGSDKSFNKVEKKHERPSFLDWWNAGMWIETTPKKDKNDLFLYQRNLAFKVKFTYANLFTARTSLLG